MNKLVLEFHSIKSAVESVLGLKGHDDTSEELLGGLRYTDLV